MMRLAAKKQKLQTDEIVLRRRLAVKGHNTSADDMEATQSE